ncbi:MAG: prepilin-type N-terminal cleavage/methylation domain-containing protein [Thomasclavelia sp.]|uniref:prepilin-type N-terminal cleavage/methylation domain-containing protein n=1 Tax=Thomasclavelia sp. TaxID=3025757 RepID=UPI00399F343F
MADKRFVYINKRGFTLIEVLFSLSICLLIVLNVLPIIKTVAYKDKITTNSSNYAIGAKQLAKILYTSKDIVVSDTLSFKDEKEQLYTITLHNNRVVKEPGFDIIIRDVKSLNFYSDNEKIYMQLNNGKKDFHYLIATNYEKTNENNEQIE